MARHARSDTFGAHRTTTRAHVRADHGYREISELRAMVHARAHRVARRARNRRDARSAPRSIAYAVHDAQPARARAWRAHATRERSVPHARRRVENHSHRS